MASPASIPETSPPPVKHGPSDNAPRRSWRAWLHSLGPGIITAALVFGPSKITITAILGADYGYDLLWIVAVAIFFMIVFTTMSARVGIATRQTLLETIGNKWGRAARIAIGLGVFLVAASFQAGNSIGIGMAVAEATHTAQPPWIILFNAIAIALLFFRAFYKTLEKVMIGLICLMLFAFVTTLVLSKPAFSGIAEGFVPSLPKGSMGLVIAFMASCFSIVGAFYQSYLVRERINIRPDIRQSGKESLPGICILGLMSALVLICSAAVLHPQGVKLHAATDMARALAPVFGQYASFLFLTGLFGASFSALIGNATLGGTLLGDALGYGGKLNSGIIRVLIALVMLIGAVIAIVFGRLPLQLIVFAQAVTIFIVPFIGIALFLVANDRKVMGEWRNGLFSNIAGMAGLLIMILLAFSNAKTLFFT
ncbi:Nramp family divalent metal transporter [Compostibacter hankyongensis]|uniref:Divalent metal cation transporter n=1 Tax=Compostibacter hankyongensis TaxID=1007089 RepID=A0ABP8G9R6_9BACT